MGFGRAKEDRPTPSAVYNWRIYMISLCATLGSWMFGYNNGVIGGCMVLPAFHKDFNLPPTDTLEYTTIIGNIVSFTQIGALAGSLLVFPIVKLFGRRWALGCSGAIFFVGAVLQTFSAGSLDLMYAGRALSGLGLGSVTVVVPMYIGELSPPAIRGSLIGLYEINNQVSSLVGFWGNYFTDIGIPADQSRQWQIPLAMQLIPGGLICLASIFLPESPRWLIERDRSLQARRVLSFVRNLDMYHEYISFEVERVEDALRRQRQMMEKAPRSRWQHFKELAWPGNRNRLVIGCVLMWAANLTGTYGINSYAPAIFESIGFSGTSKLLLLSGLYALGRTLMTILGLSFFIDMLGRKKLLLLASAGIILCLLYIGGYVTVTSNGGGAGSPGGWVAMAAVYLYAISFATAWNGVPWVYCAEIFPAKIKEMCMCLTTANQWLAQFVVARVTPYMLSFRSGNLFFFFFAGCTIVSFFFVFFLVPETRGRTLEDMDEIFGTPYKGAAHEEAGVVTSTAIGDDVVRVPTGI